jgi:hypothetical protein
MNKFGNRARFSGWRDILEIPKNLNDHYTSHGAIAKQPH